MSKKRDKSQINSRQWTDDERELFAEVLTDDEDNFAFSLEQLALKKSSNNEVFEHVKIAFDKALKTPEFIYENEKNNFTDADGKITLSKQLDTSIDKLRNKYKLMKKKWSEITQKVQSGSGIRPVDEPSWYKHLNTVFSETNEDFKLASSANDLSFIEDTGEVSGDSNLGHKTNDSDNSEEDEPEQPPPKKKLVVAPHKKNKVVRSNKQALSQLADGLKQMADAQTKRHKESLEAEKIHFEMLLNHRKEEAAANRAHELRMAEIFARTSTPIRGAMAYGYDNPGVRSQILPRPNNDSYYNNSGFSANLSTSFNGEARNRVPQSPDQNDNDSFSPMTGYLYKE